VATRLLCARPNLGGHVELLVVERARLRDVEVLADEEEQELAVRHCAPFLLRAAAHAARRACGRGRKQRSGWPQLLHGCWHERRAEGRGRRSVRLSSLCDARDRSHSRSASGSCFRFI